MHVEGALGELAVAKALGMYWSGSINGFRAPDVGQSIQVRTRSRHDYDLIVRDSDADEAAFVLVTGSAPEYHVRGWMRGALAKRDEYRQEHGGRPPAYFVPAAHLLSLGALEAA